VQHDHLEKSQPTARLETLSDGVFAFAATLLIINIKIPDTDILRQVSLPLYLLQLWPAYFAYIFTFVNIGIWWTNHQALYRLFIKTDHYFVMLNVLFLMAIAFYPFPTAILGESGRYNLSDAVSFYAIGNFITAFFWLMLWLYASHHKRLVHPHLSRRYIRSLSWQFLLSVLLYGIASVVALFSPQSGLIILLVVTLRYVFPPKNPEFIEQ